MVFKLRRDLDILLAEDRQVKTHQAAVESAAVEEILITLQHQHSLVLQIKDSQELEVVQKETFIITHKLVAQGLWL